MKKILLALSTIILIIGLVFYFFTLESFQEIEISRMKMSGITNVKTHEFHYFEKNNCESGEKCQCALLIHGLGDFALTWHKMMALNKNAFKKNIHFYAVNLPGALSTPKLNSLGDYNVQKMGKIVADFFLPLCDEWVLVGNSYGGWMAVYMALSNEKVKGLLLLGPAGIKKDYSEITNYFLNPTLDGAKDFYNRLYAKPRDPPDFIFQRVIERVKTQTVVEQLKTIGDEDFLDAHLGDLKVPVQFVWGDKDRVIPSAWANTYKNLTPNSNLKIINNCGHVPQKECVMDVVQEFNKLLSRIE